MPKIENEPENLRPYSFHGLEFPTYREGAKEALAAKCPFCDRENKFSVVIATGIARCPACNEGTDSQKVFKGVNATSFIRLLHAKSFDATPISAYKELAFDRTLTYPDTLVTWEAARSITTGDWILPGYNSEGKICQLYRYIFIEGKRRLILTPTLGHKLFGVSLYSDHKPILYLAEGPWDAVALWEVLGGCKEVEGGLSATASKDNSLLASANVLAVPGCEVFFDAWLPLFAGKTVRIMFDNDHERKHPKTGAMIPPGALRGLERISKILSAAKEPPESISFVKWGDKGGQWTSDLSHGYDVRDFINAG